VIKASSIPDVLDIKMGKRKKDKNDVFDIVDFFSI
jgi:hypothetical protein